MKKNYFIILATLLSSFTYGQKLSVATLFSDGCVLQQNATVPVWGTARVGTEITVKGSWDNKEIKVTAGSGGRWEALLKTPDGGNTPYTLTVNDKIIKDILIGEVWICAGQSNMKFRLGESWEDNWTVKDDNIPTLRFFEVEVTRSAQPATDIKGMWRYGAFSGNMQHISAVGYYFGRRLQEILEVPVGLIGIYEGGTAAEEWTEKKLFDECQSLKGTYTGTQPVGCLYNGMVAPVLPYKNSGIIWYQGENNAGRRQSYKTLLELMVTGWRTGFRDTTLPFYIVQLTSYGNDDWRTFREIQQNIAEELPNSGLAVTIDCGDETEIHPRRKKPVGDRLADIALGRVYGTAHPVSSPVYRSHTIEGNKMRLYFTYVTDGFVLTGENQEPAHFEISGPDGNFLPANARIEGNTILLWHDDIPQPVAARYFWKKYAVPNIFTRDQRPIAPFRTQK